MDFRDTVSGWCGSACLAVCAAPFDLVKVRQQLPGSSGSSAAVLQQLLRSEGLLALWRGVGPAFSSAVVENTVVFTSNGLLLRALGHSAGSGSSSSSSSSLWQHAVCGSISGIFSSLAICPCEVVKCKQQTAAPGSSSALACCRAILAGSSGASGFYAGLAPLMLRDIPLNAVMFGSYSLYSRALAWALPSTASASASASEEPAGWRALLAGGLAGSTAWAAVFPADTLKSRMQASGSSGGSVRSVLAQVLAEAGPRGLYKGCGAAVLRAFVANGALFWGVEASRQLLGAE